MVTSCGNDLLKSFGDRFAPGDIVVDSYGRGLHLSGEGLDGRPQTDNWPTTLFLIKLVDYTDGKVVKEGKKRIIKLTDPRWRLVVTQRAGLKIYLVGLIRLNQCS